MKAVCHICEQVCELSSLFFGKDSGIIGSGEDFHLLPKHEGVPGKSMTKVVSQKSGEVIEEMCDGSLRPPRIRIQ